jgi:CBS domain-containing protein
MSTRNHFLSIFTCDYLSRIGGKTGKSDAFIKFYYLLTNIFYPLIAIKGRSSTSTAAEMMIKNDVRHLLVIDDRNKPIGIITPLDLTRNQGSIADEDREAIETVLDRYMEWL